MPSATEFLWLATSDLKDLHVHRGDRMIPFLGVLSELIANGVAVRLLHAKEPGPMFRQDFDRYPNLIDGTGAHPVPPRPLQERDRGRPASPTAAAPT